MFGDAIESWGGTQDIGRDAFCPTGLEFTKGTISAAPVVFQVKFVQHANSPGADWQTRLLAAIRAECKRLTRHFDSGKIKDIGEYVLISNAPLTATFRPIAAELIQTSLPGTNVRLFGASDVCGWLDLRKELRWSYPELLSIRDIDYLIQDRMTLAINKAVMERTTLQLELAQALSRCFVATKTFREAVSVLAKHRFLVLSGPPEMGKTAIARIVGLTAHFFGWHCYEVQNPQELLHTINRNSSAAHAAGELLPRQLFIADDAFGTTEYDQNFAIAWSKDLDKILAALDTRHLMIWTSRSAPLLHALNVLRLQGPAERFPDPAKVVVDAAELTVEEKALILLRHAKAHGLSDEAKAIVRRNGHAIVSSRHFTPLRIKRFVQTDLPKLLASEASLVDVEKSIAAQLKDPSVEMRQSFLNLSEHRQAVLISLLDCQSHGVSPEDIAGTFQRIFGDAHDYNGEVIARELEEQFIVRLPDKRTSERKSMYEWVHPSWRDLVIEHLITHPLTRRRFLSRCGHNGLALALSVAGGAAGERTFPLLVDAEDWRCITSNAEQLVLSFTSTATENLLALVRYSLTNCPSSKRSDLESFATTLISTFVQAWTQQQSHVSIRSSELVYELSDLLKHPFKVPLMAMWMSRLSNLEETAIEGGDFDCISDDFQSLSDLLRITRQRQPQLLDLFTSALTKRIRILELLLDQFEDEAESYHEDFGYDQDHLEDTKSKFTDAVLSLEAVQQILPDCNARIQAVTGSLRKYEKQVSRRLNEPVDDEEQDDHYEPRFPSKAEPVIPPPSPMSDEQLVDAILVDL